MTTLTKFLSWSSYVLAAFAILVSPWLFGAWEQWWFWPLASLLFVAVLCFALRLVLGDESIQLRLLWDTWPMRVAVSSMLLFLAYALTQFVRVDVYVSAERSFLLFLTPVLISVMVISGFSRSQLFWLYVLIAVDLFLLGFYGIANHHATDSSRVMWVLTEYSQYQGRASGPFFCPDHFSGILEILLACSLGVLLGNGSIKVPELQNEQQGRSGGRRRRRSRTMAGANRVVALTFAVVALLGVWLSKSRGGGLTVIVLGFAGITLGFSKLRARTRWLARGGLILVGLLSLVIMWNLNSGYVSRFKSYFGWEEAKELSRSEMKQTIWRRLQGTSRYNMYSAAWRAWQTSRVTGIGPGMHQHLWPHFAASPDGDRSQGRRPTYLNFKRYSYEVHSDWLQLLEEYGIVGFVLFCIPLISVVVLLLQGLRDDQSTSVVIGGILAVIALSFHSLGDFNLQMPAITWVLSAVIAIAMAHAMRTEG